MNRNALDNVKVQIQYLDQLASLTTEHSITEEVINKLLHETFTLTSRLLALDRAIARKGD